MSIPPGLPAMDVTELLHFCAGSMFKLQSAIQAFFNARKYRRTYLTFDTTQAMIPAKLADVLFG